MSLLRRTPTFAWALIIVAVGSIFGLSAQATDPAIGTWKANLAKSKYRPGPAPKSATVRFAPAGQGIEVWTEGVGATGTTTATHYTASYDGKEYPITGSQTTDTVSLRRIDRFTSERTDRKGGKVVATLTRVVAKDGKTMTITTKGTNAQGQAVNNVVVYDKQ